jgi:hypothetical protein
MKNRRQLDLAALISLLPASMLIGCAGPDIAPNYDHLIGKKFSHVIHLSKSIFQRNNETDFFEELYIFGRNECKTIYGVRKSDDVIIYWRVEPSPEACKIRARTISL